MGDLHDEMRLAVLEGEEEAAATLANQVLERQLDPIQAMNEGFLKGIREAGELYQSGEYYLPELVCSADAMKSALSILQPAMQATSDQVLSKGLALLATVEGDIHDIGKTILGAMLTAGGYEVVDLGSDVPLRQILAEVKEKRPNILGMSALLTTTMEGQKTVLDLLAEEGLRDHIKVLVGGAPVSREWSERIGADGYADNAVDAVHVADRLMEGNK